MVFFLKKHFFGSYVNHTHATGAALTNIWPNERERERKGGERGIKRDRAKERKTAVKKEERSVEKKGKVKMSESEDTCKRKTITKRREWGNGKPMIATFSQEVMQTLFWITNYSQYSELLQWIPFFLRKLWTVVDQKPMVKKIWKIWMGKPWDGLPSSPENQKEDKNPSGSYHNHLPPIFLGLWGCFDGWIEN